MKNPKSIHSLFLNRVIIVVTFFLVTAFMPSCGKKDTNSAKSQHSQHTEIDYFDAEGSTTAQVHGTVYTLVDDYTKWIPVLYQKRDFNAIEQHISGLLSEGYEAKAYELYVLYSVLGTITHDKHIEHMQTVLDKWCSKHADSHIPWLVRGSFYIHYAWTIRGSGWAKSVPEEAWPKVHEKLELAKKDLEKSWQLNPSDPNSSCSLLLVATGLSYSKEVMEKYYENGISVCPWHYGVCYQKLNYLKPKWHGSSEEMFGFAKQCLMLSRQYPFLGLIMVSAIEEAHRYNPEKENILGKDEVWETVEGIYAGFFARYPNNIVRRFWYAYHAYKAQKYEVALKQFEIIGDRWMEDTCWYSLEYYNRSRATAFARVGEEYLLKKRLYEISIGYFQKAVKYNPDDYSYYRLGQAYMYSGSSTRNVAYLRYAEEYLQKAIDLKGRNSKHAEGELAKLRQYMRK